MYPTHQSLKSYILFFEFNLKYNGMYNCMFIGGAYKKTAFLLQLGAYAKEEVLSFAPMLPSTCVLPTTVRAMLKHRWL